jgi:hypothetical protein
LQIDCPTECGVLYPSLHYWRSIPAQEKLRILQKGFQITVKLISLFSILALSAAPILEPSLGTSLEQGVITLNPQTAYQTINGWEVTAQAGQVDETDRRLSPGPYVNASKPFQLYKDRLFDLAVNDLGLNRVRLEMACGAENPVDYYDQYLRGRISFQTWRLHRYETINDDNDPFHINPSGFQFTKLDYTIEQVVLPLKQRLEAKGEKLFINTCNVCFEPTNLLKSNPEEYAEYVLATYQHMQSKYGFVPDSWEVILEADISLASWSGAQIADAIVATQKRLLAARFSPNFIVPSASFGATNSKDLYKSMKWRNRAALKYVSEVSYHRYAPFTNAELTDLKNTVAEDGKTTFMSEWIGADYTTLLTDLKVGNNSSWSEFVLAYPDMNDDGGKYYLIDQRNQFAPSVIMASRTKFLRQYFKFIRKGAVRIGAATTNTSLDPVAFINADGKYVVVVNADAGGSFTIQGLPSGTYGIKFTTFRQYDVDRPDVTIGAGQTLGASIPDAGVITVYAKTSKLNQPGKKD